MHIQLAVMAQIQAQAAMHPELEWLLSDYDSWHRNPAYTGPRGPHPDDIDAQEEIEAFGFHVWQWRSKHIAEARAASEARDFEVECPF